MVWPVDSFLPPDVFPSKFFCKVWVFFGFVGGTQVFFSVSMMYFLINNYAGEL